MTFKDYFSNHAQIYAQHRPAYPLELFEYLSTLVSRHDTVWDCGTGNGQVAIGLIPYFQHIYATDASAQQIEHAIAHPQVEYAVATAEHTNLPTHSIDLITVGLALHWFNFELFYPEVRRVLRPEGAIAAWCYSDVELPTATQELRDRLTDFRQLVYPYFAPEIDYIWARYETLPFPFAEQAAPPFRMTATWTVDNFIGYLQSLSGTQRCREQHGAEKLNALAQPLITTWQASATTLPVQWQIYLKVGKVEKPF
ncbi:MAG: methyltransferase domain-containing protein [Leptolyngbyaceae cyanobacterium bins.349]|nr:methyltransferase domain-containing protein [Leptolyngbyaceae cyanobacterium bins.349]